MKWYKVTKTFQGGSWTKYVHLPDKVKVDANWLDDFGDHTEGGHNYGYQIKAKQIKPTAEIVDSAIKKERPEMKRLHRHCHQAISAFMKKFVLVENLKRLHSKLKKEEKERINGSR